MRTTAILACLLVAQLIPVALADHCFVDKNDDYCYMCTTDEEFFGKEFLSTYKNERPTVGGMEWRECVGRCSHGFDGCKKSIRLENRELTGGIFWGCVKMDNGGISDVSFCGGYKEGSDMCPEQDGYQWIDCGSVCDTSTEECGSGEDVYACISSKLNKDFVLNYDVESCIAKSDYLKKGGESDILCGDLGAEVVYCGSKSSYCSAKKGDCRAEKIIGGNKATNMIGPYVFACVEGGAVKFCTNSIPTSELDYKEATLRGIVIDEEGGFPSEGDIDIGLKHYEKPEGGSEGSISGIGVDIHSDGSYSLTTELGCYTIEVTKVAPGQEDVGFTLDLKRDVIFEGQICLDRPNTVYTLNFALRSEGNTAVAVPVLKSVSGEPDFNHLEDYVAVDHEEKCNGQFVDCGTYCNAEENEKKCGGDDNIFACIKTEESGSSVSQNVEICASNPIDLIDRCSENPKGYRGIEP